MRACAPCGAFLQPEWDRCKICGAPAGAPADHGRPDGPHGKGRDGAAAPGAFSTPGIKVAALGVALVMGFMAFSLITGGDDDEPADNGLATIGPESSAAGDGPDAEEGPDGGIADEDEADADGNPDDGLDEMLDMLIPGMERELGVSIDAEQRRCMRDLFTGDVEQTFGAPDQTEAEQIAAFRSTLLGGCLEVDAVVHGALVGLGISEAGAACVATGIAADEALTAYWWAVDPRLVPTDAVVRTDELARTCLTTDEYDRWAGLG